MPKRARKAPTVRLTIDLSRQLYDRLEQMEEAVGAESKAQVVRDSLQLYEYVAARAREGYEFQLAKGEEVKTVVVFRLTPATQVSGASTGSPLEAHQAAW